MKLKEMDQIKLISIVKENPMLYENCLQSCRNRRERKELWDKIAKELNSSGKI